MGTVTTVAVTFIMEAGGFFPLIFFNFILDYS